MGTQAIGQGYISPRITQLELSAGGENLVTIMAQCDPSGPFGAPLDRRRRSACGKRGQCQRQAKQSRPQE